MSIVGAGPDKTIIEWDPSVKQDATKGDRVFHIEAVSSNIDPASRVSPSKTA